MKTNLERRKKNEKKKKREKKMRVFLSIFKKFKYANMKNKTYFYKKAKPINFLRQIDLKYIREKKYKKKEKKKN